MTTRKTTPAKKTSSPKTSSPKTSSPKAVSPKAVSPKAVSPKAVSPKTTPAKTGTARKGAKIPAETVEPAAATAKTTPAKTTPSKATKKIAAKQDVEVLEDPTAEAGTVYTPVFGGRLKIEHDKGSLSSDDWNDANKEMFVERNLIRDEIAKLEARLAKRGDVATKAKLRRKKSEFEDKTLQIIEFNYGLVKKYVRKFTGSATRDQALEFEQAALLGLMRAIDNYDPTRGRFAQWAFKPIQREVLRAVHSSDHNNMNPGDFERRPDILKALKKLQGDDEGRKPTPQEVAAEAGVTVEQARRVLEAPRMDSLYTPVGDGESVLGDLIVDTSDDLEDKVLNSISVKALETYGLQALDPRERFVIIRRQGLDCEPEQRLSAIGELLGLSREAIRQIEAKAVAKMSHPVLLRRLTRNGKP